MKLSFRWYGEDDKISLKEIRQIPGMIGIVTSLYDIPPGEFWPREKINQLKRKIKKFDLEISAIESVPVHEDIKLGTPTRDQYIDNYRKTIKNLGREGIDVVTYNFMPVFDWTRSKLDHKLKDGSKVLIYEHGKIQNLDPVEGELDLPGWDITHQKEEIKELMAKYRSMDEDKLWANLKYFLEKIIPIAEEENVYLAIHPDDPPWPIFELPRIITDRDSLDKLINLVDSHHNGLAICSGSLGADPNNNLPEIIREFGGKNRIHFAHIRNIEITGEKCFQERAHLSSEGSLDIVKIMQAYHDVGFSGPLRPDHGRMIWGEKGKPGYGLYDRALGATYINGIWETLKKIR